MNELALVDVQTVKDYCKIKDTGVSAGNVETIDEILSSLITRASAFLVSKIGKKFIFAQDVTEVRNGNGKCEMFATVFPINGVTSVSVDGIAIPQRTTPVGFGWVFDSDTLYLVGYTFTLGVQNVVIQWNCGISTTSRKAYVLQQACLELVNIKWQVRKHPDLVREKSGGMVTNEYRDSDITDSISEAIELLRDGMPFE
jgi:hypothetical protein